MYVRMTTISIVTKTYNRCAFLKECVESVQKLKNEPYENQIKWEHVIYDDGSTDETPEYCMTHPSPHVHYIRSEENEGVSKAANRAIKRCESDWIFELDSDDIAPSRLLHNFYEAVLRHPATSWFVMDFYRVDAVGKYQVGEDYYGWQYKSPKDILEAIFRGEHFIQHNVFYKRILWEQAGIYRETLGMAEDLDLYIRFLLLGQMPIYLPTISHFHRNHIGNISKDVTHDSHKKDLKNLAKIYEKELKNLGLCIDL